MKTNLDSFGLAGITRAMARTRAMGIRTRGRAGAR